MTLQLGKARATLGSSTYKHLIPTPGSENITTCIYIFPCLMLGAWYSLPFRGQRNHAPSATISPLSHPEAAIDAHFLTAVVLASCSTRVKLNLPSVIPFGRLLQSVCASGTPWRKEAGAPHTLGGYALRSPDFASTSTILKSSPSLLVF